MPRRKRILKNISATTGRWPTFMDRLIEEAKACGHAKTLYGGGGLCPSCAPPTGPGHSFGKGVPATCRSGHGRGYQTRHGAGAPPEESEEDAGPLILQVHDELIVEAPESGSRETRRLLKGDGECGIAVGQKLVADVGIGKTPGTTPKGKPAGCCGIFRTYNQRDEEFFLPILVLFNGFLSSFLFPFKTSLAPCFPSVREFCRLCYVVKTEPRWSQSNEARRPFRVRRKYEYRFLPHLLTEATTRHGTL